MKIWIFIFLLGIFFIQKTEGQIVENFSDGNFTDPLWYGDTSLYQINSSGQLQSKGIAGLAGQSAVAVENTRLKNTEWTFWIRFNLSPSGSNFCRFYLSSDQEDLKGNLNGYFVQFGGSTGSTDTISLFKQSGSSKTRIIAGRPGTVAKSNNVLKIKVNCDVSGNWELFSDTSLSGNFILEGSCIDNTINTSNYSGIYCKYTSSYVQSFYLDDLRISEIGKDSVITITPVLQPEFKDILITEILADPTPRIGLPEKEFLEIFNKSANPFNLNGFTISDPTTTAIINGVTLTPNAYLILCKSSDTADFRPYGNVKGLSNFPTLNNDGDVITFKNSDGKIIDKVTYSIDWYRDGSKKDGGWSLELINPYTPCVSAANWKPSVSLIGGTPGKVNSVFDNSIDSKAPELTKIDLIDSTCIQLFFSEVMDSLSLALGKYSVNNKTLETSIKAIYTEQNSLQLNIIPSLKAGSENSIEISGVQDCSGNNFISTNPFNFICPEQCDSFDVIINEVLFNPKPNGVDFVEIYNRTNKYLDLKNWEIANFDKGSVSNNKIISQEHFIVPPYKYAVLTADSAILKSQYTVEENVCMQVPSMPAMNDDKGTVILINNNHQVIDRFDYSEDYHYSLLSDKEGVSLERISNTAKTNSKENWHSASSITGFASPGFKNSQNLEEVKNSGISIDPKVITPDEDGYKDFALINYKFNQQGNIATVTIFDKQGREIRNLVKNQLLGTEGFFQWDGITDNKSVAEIGPYIIYIQIFNAKGEVKNYKETVVVAIK